MGIRGYAMARLRLWRFETTRDRLPAVCMICGQPSVTHISKSFRWSPGGDGWNLAAMYFKQMAVAVPVCDRHRRYFMWRKIAIAVTTGLLFLVPAINSGVIQAGVQAPNQELTGIMFGILGFVVGVVPAVMILWLIRNNTVRAAEITERGITLKRVHDNFVAAFNEMARARDFDDELDNRPRLGEIDQVLPADQRDTYQVRRDNDPPRRRRFRDDD